MKDRDFILNEILESSKKTVLLMDWDYISLMGEKDGELLVTERLITAFSYAITTRKYMNIKCNKIGVVAILCDEFQKQFITNQLSKMKVAPRFDRICFIDIRKSAKNIEEEIRRLSPNYILFGEYDTEYNEIFSLIQNMNIPFFCGLSCPSEDRYEIDELYPNLKNAQYLFLKITKMQDTMYCNIKYKDNVFGTYYFKQETNIAHFFPGHTPSIEAIDRIFQMLLTKEVWNTENLCWETKSTPKFQNEIERILLVTSFCDFFHSIGGVDTCINIAKAKGIIRKCTDKELIASCNTKQAIHNHSCKRVNFTWEYVSKNDV